MIPADRFAADNSLVEYTPTEAAAIGLNTRGIRDGSNPRLELAVGSSSAELKWLLDPANYWPALTLMLGAVTRYTDGTSGTYKLSRLMPYSLYAMDMNRVGFMRAARSGVKFLNDVTTDGVPIPDHRYIDMVFNAWTLPFETANDTDTAGNELLRYVETLPDEDTTKYINMPGVSAGLKYLRPDNAAGTFPHLKGVPYNIGVPFITAKVRRKWYRLPKVCLAEASPLVQRWRGVPGTTLPYYGTCNKTDFLGYPAGTLVFKSARAERVFDPVAMDYAYDILYEWDYLPNGANMLFAFDPDGNRSGWYLAARNRTTWTDTASLGDNEVLFPPREHANLFEVGTVP